MTVLIPKSGVIPEESTISSLVRLYALFLCLAILFEVLNFHINTTLYFNLIMNIWHRE